MGMGLPRWSVSIKYLPIDAETNTSYTTRTISGINFNKGEITEDSVDLTGYSSAQIDAFARAYVALVNGTVTENQLTANYQINGTP